MVFDSIVYLLRTVSSLKKTLLPNRNEEPRIKYPTDISSRISSWCEKTKNTPLSDVNVDK